jgi:hypothetical protein
MTVFPILLAVLSALLPVIAWYFILRRKNNQRILQRAIVTFIFAGCGALLFLSIKDPVQAFLVNHLHSLFVVLLLFGVCIEYFKNFIVRLTGIGFFKNMNDVLDLSFAAALGFTFFENTFYLSVAFEGKFPGVEGPVEMFKFFLLRVFFIPPVHLFCSGIFGYFYGLGLFSTDTLKAKNEGSFMYRLFTTLLFFIPAKIRYRSVKIAQGSALSVLCYGVFFLLLEKNFMVSDFIKLLNFPPLPVDEQLIPVIAFVFFKVGTIGLFSLMDKKRRWENQGLLKAE